MSYILDALRKAERERTRGAVPGLDAQQAEAPLARRRRTWPLWIGFALLVNALVLGWLLWPRAERPVVPVASVAVPAPSAPVPAAPAAQAVAPPVAPPVSVPAAPSLPARQNPPPAPVVEPPQVNPAAPQSLPPVVAGDAAADASADDAAMETSPTPSRVPDSEPQVPGWNELSPEQRAALPKVGVDVHVYADDPAQRFVLINMRRYMEGERLPEGPTLDTITEDGVILDHNGVRYRIERQ